MSWRVSEKTTIRDDQERVGRILRSDRKRFEFLGGGAQVIVRAFVTLRWAAAIARNLIPHDSIAHHRDADPRAVTV